MTATWEFGARSSALEWYGGRFNSFAIVPIWQLYKGMDEVSRARWRRRAAFLIAAAFHVLLVWLIVPQIIDHSEPPAIDSVEVALLQPMFVPTKTAAPETRLAHQAPELQAIPDLAEIVPPPIILKLPSSPKALSAARPIAPGNRQDAPPGYVPHVITMPYGATAVPFSDYYMELQRVIDARRVADVWGNIPAKAMTKLEIELVVDDDGTLLESRVTTSSGSAQIDEQVLNQLKAMSPFPPPPTNRPKPHVVRLTWQDLNDRRF